MQVGSAVQLSGFFMCLLGAARITHRAQRIVSIASQWHMSLESSSTHNCKSSSASDAVDASSHVSGSSTAAVSQLAEPSAPCSYSSRQALGTHATSLFLLSCLPQSTEAEMSETERLAFGVCCVQ
jgi:hypothetical protein